MLNGTKVRFRSSIAALMLAGGALATQPASAQLFFDWGGDQKPNDTGRQIVSINTDAKPGEIIVSFSDRRLYLITVPGMALSYPIAIPREQDRWEGKTSVTQKRENPSWTPTPTMIKENPRLPRWVPGGHPMNPLGNRALYLGSSFYRIHGTDAPWTIGTAVSKGCIRMYNKDALDVYEQVKVGAKVLVTWKNYQVGEPTGRMAERAMDEAGPAPRSSAQRSTDKSMPEQSTRRQRQRAEIPEDDGVVAKAKVERDAPAGRSTRTREATQQRDVQPERPQSAGNSPRASERQVAPAKSAKPKASSIETGALPEKDGSSETGSVTKIAERKEHSEPSTALPAQAARQAQSNPAPEAVKPQVDVAAKALEAAERAAAAAERAAAAAERAERAASARERAAKDATAATTPAREAD